MMFPDPRNKVYSIIAGAQPHDVRLAVRTAGQPIAFCAHARRMAFSGRSIVAVISLDHFRPIGPPADHAG